MAGEVVCDRLELGPGRGAYQPLEHRVDVRVMHCVRDRGPVDRAQREQRAGLDLENRLDLAQQVVCVRYLWWRGFVAHQEDRVINITLRVEQLDQFLE